MFDKIMDFFKELDSSTLMILVFAAILVIFLIILIIVTVHVLKTANSDVDDEDEKPKKAEKAKPQPKWDDSSEDETTVLKPDESDSDEEDEDSAEEDEDEDSDSESDSEDDDEDDYEDEDDEDDISSSKVDGFRAEFNSAAAERSAEEALRVAEAVNNEVAAHEAAMEQADAKTNEIDTKAIKEALRAEREQKDSKKAASDAERADYNAKMDSAFVPEGTAVSDIPEGIPVNKVEGFVLSDEAIESATEASLAEHDKVVAQSEDKITVNPVNQVNINTVNSVDRVDTKSDEAGISGIQDMESFLTENPVPKKKKKKVKKRDQIFEDKFESDDDEIPTGEYFWYNSQDIDGLKRKEDMYYYCHYFSSPSQAVIPLVTEMYDCAFVRTEEIQLIAYGVQFKSMKMKDILMAKEGVGFDHSNATKEPSEKDFQEIYRKWCGYVDNFLTIIVINAPDNVKTYLKNALYEYGRTDDVEMLLHSPE
ncbi:MAG: hypothetical protein J6O17_00740 [Eubacterium sp.]|nr:hypothetical protein [Eubacterium sp.]